MTLLKDDAILSLLDRLQLTERGWEVVDHWEADRCAIGIRSLRVPGHLVYISVFDKPGELYYFEAEAEDSEAELGYEVVEDGQSVTYDALLAALERHLASDRAP